MNYSTSTFPGQIGSQREGSAPTAPSATPPASARPLDSAAPHRWWRGREEDPRWVRPAVVGLLVATALLYLWGLGASGWANSFYSAAVQAGSESWKAFFFGSSDAASSITVDKTPLALWPMALSVRLFGLSSWSILVPQALMGVATVGLLHGTMRRATGSPVAGLIAGAAMALTPVAVLMFRFNNPDALLVLLLVGSASATLRAVEASDRGRPMRWLALAGTLVGLAFLAKMLQAFLVLPALGLVYLLCARTTLPRRLGHLLVALCSMVLAGGWWVAIVQLWPASSRPYIGGSQHNSILELTLGYNGLGRLSGNETGSVGGGGGWGSTGILRLLNSEIGGQIAWLLPAALVLGGAALWFARREGRVRAAVVLWLTWLLVTALTFSFMAGIFHAYYTVALAPAAAALVGIGAVTLWRHRSSLLASGLLALTTAFTAAFAFQLLGRTDGYLPWLRWLVLLVGVVAAALLVGASQLPRRIALAVAALAVVSSLAGPAAYALSTASTPHTGSIPSAGPTTTVGFGGPVGARPPGMTGTPPGGAGGMGGLLNGSSSPAAVTTLLRTDADAYTWAAAAVGSNTASGYQLASGEPVMAIGGFNGSDPSPTLAQFQRYVANGQIHYFLAGGQGNGGGPGGNTSSAIASWVATNFTATTVSGVTLYDLSGGIR